MDGVTKILTFRTDRIGDLINTSSFLKSLKDYYPNSEIHLVCSKYNSQIAKNYNFIDKISIVDQQKKIFSIIKIFLELFLSIMISALLLMARLFQNLFPFLCPQSKNI